MSEYDAIVCGGGLAGLTLAYQLRREAPEASVAVIERTTRPLPEACHKVGESSVELSSHYFDQVLGLHDYLKAEHIEKNGLRFFCGNGRAPLHTRPEIGPSEFPVLPSYQLDRGKLETDLRGFVERAGVDLMEGRAVREITLGANGASHRVRLDDDRVLEGRWLLDASGRARLLSKKLDLKRPSTNRADAAWFRVRGRVRVGDLVPDEEKSWHARDVDDNRWQSTVHLMDTGYWVWLIPLSTGFTSVGVVADQKHHQFADYAREDKMRAWLAAHEPVLAAKIADVPFEDFRVMRDYSYLASRMIDAEARWACVGEAALFVDPLYSLGGDFLAMGCSYATRLVSDDLAGRLDLDVARELEATYLLLAEDAVRTLRDNGAIFPREKILGAKLWWDFYNYWSFMSAHFFQEIWREDAETLRAFREMGERYYALNTIAQRVLEGWADIPSAGNSAARSFVPLPMFPSVLANQHIALGTKRSPAETLAKMDADLQVGRELVTEVLAHALRDVGLAGAAELGRRVGLDAASDLVIDARAEFDGLPRRERVARMPDIGRDMERALGRKEGDAPLRDLLVLARGERSHAEPAPGERLRTGSHTGKAPALP